MTGASTAKSNLDSVVDHLLTLKSENEVTYRVLADLCGASLPAVHGAHHGQSDLATVQRILDYYALSIVVEGAPSHLSLGAQLRAVRLDKRVTVMSLPMSPATIRRIEGGNAACRMVTICAFADALGAKLAIVPSLAVTARTDLEAWQSSRVIPEALHIFDGFINEFLSGRVERAESRC